MDLWWFMVIYGGGLIELQAQITLAQNRKQIIFVFNAELVNI